MSKRFSKRASILPPPALDLLKESPSEPVPKIPEQYKTPTTGNTQNGMFVAGALAKPPVERSPSPPPYEQKQHAYAVRGLREYEDCLDEWELFVHRAKEEEGADGKEVCAAPCDFDKTELTVSFAAQCPYSPLAVCLAFDLGRIGIPF